jgi:formylglycine-generating enzyme required for sulfatase activity
MLSLAWTSALQAMFAAWACSPSWAGQLCVGDLNNDARVDGKDLATVIAQWGKCGSDTACIGDANADGTVNAVDLSLVLASWGGCPVVLPSWATLVEAYPDPDVVWSASLRDAIAATGYAWRVKHTASQIEMVLIPSGSFWMGCDQPPSSGPCAANQFPVHWVTLTDAFYIGRYEVTQAQWVAQMGSNPSYYLGQDHPVENVSWQSVQQFTTQSGLRLPTEAEWEYACRAGTATAFHGFEGHWNGTNNDALADLIAWHGYNSSGHVQRVGSKFANGFGLHDMSGNVIEWVSDWYSPTYYSVSPPINPSGPSTGTERVLRSGGWWVTRAGCGSSSRGALNPQEAFDAIGFRVAKSP